MKEKITIKELKEAKAELEQTIAKLIDDFENNYGVTFKGIDNNGVEYVKSPCSPLLLYRRNKFVIKIDLKI